MEQSAVAFQVKLTDLLSLHAHVLLQRDISVANTSSTVTLADFRTCDVIAPASTCLLSQEEDCESIIDAWYEG